MPWLVLEQLGPDVFRGNNQMTGNWQRQVFGGQILAQALRAALHTVEADRAPHSLHAYFLRRPDPPTPLVFTVERHRDGRGFSARRVTADQGGKVVFEMTASFQLPEDGPTGYEKPPAGTRRFDEEPVYTLDDEHPPIEMRLVSPPRADDDPRPASRDLLWCRVGIPLPDDPVMHACLLAFFTDLGSGFGDLENRRLPPFAPSIDHAIWFHQPARVDDWVLTHSVPVAIGGGRGLYRGTTFDLEGRMICTFAQEMVLREQ